MKTILSAFILLSVALKGYSSEITPLQDNHPIMNELIHKIRTPETDQIAFREALKKIGEYIGLEIAKTLPTKEVSVTTVMNASATHNIIDGDLVLIPVLRAGLPLYSGLQEAFPQARSGFLGAMRDEETLKAYIDYQAFPEMKGKTVIIADTMIATGGSIIDTIKLIKKFQPKRIIIAGVMAATAGLERISEYDPEIDVFAACIDHTLNDVGYIVPGLGDAGDRCYGSKLPRE